LLLGNHELAQASRLPIWKGDTDLTEAFRRGTQAAYGPRAGEVYAAYEEIFAVSPAALRTANRVFLSHSLPAANRLAAFDLAALERDVSTPADLAAGGSIYSLLWGRDSRPEHVAEFLARVDADLLITGHLGCDRGFDWPNDRQIVLDCSGPTAAFCLFPCDRPLTHAELIGCISTL
jgi:hypothetical protein